MRRRLYFMLPDVHSAKQVVDDLLLARIEARHIHVLAPRDAEIGDLPEATVFQKTDLVHGAPGRRADRRAARGGGRCAAGYLPTGEDAAPTRHGPDRGRSWARVFGLWVASLAGASVPNSRLRQFRAWIDQGKLLLMVDVPFSSRRASSSSSRGVTRKPFPAAASRRFPRFRDPSRCDTDRAACGLKRNAGRQRLNLSSTRRARRVAVVDLEPCHRYRQAEPAGSGAAGVQIQHPAGFADCRTMRVTRDHRTNTQLAPAPAASSETSCKRCKRKPSSSKVTAVG